MIQPRKTIPAFISRKPRDEEDIGFNLVANDREFQKRAKSLKACQRRMKNLGRLVEEVANIPSEQDEGLIYRTARHLIPKRFVSRLVPELVHERMPGFSKFVSEEADLLDRGETMLRCNTNDIQEGLRDTAQVAKKEKARIYDLQHDLQQAVDEKWDAKKLQEYLAKEAEIEVLYEEVADLLDNEYGLLSDEVKEERKRSILESLKLNLELKARNIDLLNEVCKKRVIAFHDSAAQLFFYTQMKDCVRQIRNAAENSAETYTQLYGVRDALMLTIKESVDTLGQVADLCEEGRKFSIASADMKTLMEISADKLRKSHQKLLAGNVKSNKSLVETTEKGSMAVDSSGRSEDELLQTADPEAFMTQR